MYRESQDQLTPEQPVIESASATTSPDNANSGPFAYVVFGVVIGLLVLLGVGISSCASALAAFAPQDGRGYADEDTYGEPTDSPDDYEGLEDLMREWDSVSRDADPRFDS